MLHPPHTRYDRLFVYYFDRLELPPVLDPDLIGTWVEDDNVIAGMEGDLLAALPPGGVRILHRGSREMWRLWLLLNRTEEQ